MRKELTAENAEVFAEGAKEHERFSSALSSVSSAVKTNSKWRICLLITLAALLSISSNIGFAAFAQTKPDKDYLVYVVSESADKITLIRFGPNGARIDHQLDTGDMPTDIDGPHGIVISPDRQFYYVSIAHGRPFGLIWKYSTKDDSVLGKTTLGYFPATGS